VTAIAVMSRPVPSPPAPVLVRRRTARQAAFTAAAAAIAAQPLLRPNGPGNSSPVDLFTLAAILLTGVWVAGDHVRLRAPYALPVGIAAIAGIFAAMASVELAAGAIAVVQDLVLFAWAVVIATVCARPPGLRLVLRVWAFASIFMGALLVASSVAHVAAITGVTARAGNREAFTFGDPNYAALFWTLSIFVSYAAQVPRRRSWRWAGYAVLLSAFALAESNGGLLELFLGCAVIALGAVMRRYGAAAALSTALAAVVALVLLTLVLPLQTVRTWAHDSGQPLLVNSIGRSSHSASQRSVLARESIDLYTRSSPLGIGPAATHSLLDRDGYPYAKEAHDDYLAALTERGPLGLFAVLWLSALVAWYASRFIRASTTSAFTSVLPLPTGIIAALVAIAAAGWYYEVLHFRFVWALFAIVATVSRGQDA